MCNALSLDASSLGNGRAARIEILGPCTPGGEIHNALFRQMPLNCATAGGWRPGGLYWEGHPFFPAQRSAVDRCQDNGRLKDGGLRRTDNSPPKDAPCKGPGRGLGGWGLGRLSGCEELRPEHREGGVEHCDGFGRPGKECGGLGDRSWLSPCQAVFKPVSLKVPGCEMGTTG